MDEDYEFTTVEPRHREGPHVMETHLSGEDKKNMQFSMQCDSCSFFDLADVF